MSAQSGTLDTGRSLFQGNSGKWATERLIAASAANRPITASEFRTNEVLRRDEWVLFDEALISEAQIRLQGIADLKAAGLTRPIPNSMGKTVYSYETIGDMDDAIVSLDGVTRSENDRLEFGERSLPLPITHKDWYLNLRHLAASRERGESLDTTYARIAARKVAEASEEMLFNGGKTFGGLTIYGYTTHPGRETVSFGAGGAWSGAKTGAQIITDVGTQLALMEGNRMYGPYWIYVGAGASLKLQEDYKAESDISIRQRILQYEGIQNIRVVDKLASGHVLMVQASPDVVQLLEGESLQNVQWDVHGGFQINFKAFQIEVPLIRADSQDRLGVVHMS